MRCCPPSIAGIAGIERSPRWPPTRAFTAVVTRLGCRCGVSTLTASGLAVEIGDRQRLTGHSIGPYLGLVLPKKSSGTTHTQGGIAKTSNGTATPAGCWSKRPGVTDPDTGPPAARARPGRQVAAADPLGGFDERKKYPVVANAAIARELAGWCWSLEVLDDG